LKENRGGVRQLGNTAGGNATKFYASVRLDILKIGVVKNGEVVSGPRPRVKVVKKAPPFGDIDFETPTAWA
jgi:recombination protein RecA